jgi:hypothetical protein
VTWLDFKLYELAPEVVAGLLIHPLDAAPELIPQYRRVVATAADELTCRLVLRKAPSAPFVPAEWHDKEVLVIALCYRGAVAQCNLGRLSVGRRPFDPLLTAGARNYWRSYDFTTLSDAGSVYVNFMSEDGVDRVPGAYGATMTDWWPLRSATIPRTYSA